MKTARANPPEAVLTTAFSEARLDVALGAAGVAFGLVSLLFPFGRDQGVYYYVGREWLLRGSIPYRDLFDDQTPGIYAVHAIAILCFGESLWGIRLLELFCIVLVGIVASTFAVAPRLPGPGGLRGACVLVASVLYYGFLNFWDTGQLEIWCSTLGLASIWAARRIETRARAEVVAGAFAALALIVKPPAALFAMCALGLCVFHVWGDRPERKHRVFRASLRFVLGLAGPFAIVVLYFGMHQALAPMFELLVDAGGYIGRESSIRGPADIANATLYQYQSYAPVSVALVAALVITTAVFHRRADFATRNRRLLSALLCLLGFLAVLVQRRFFGFHWAILIGPATCVAANAIVDIECFTAGKRRAIRVGAVVLAIAIWVDSNGYRHWITENKAALAFLTGRINREEFTRRFSLPTLGFSACDAEQAGLWLKAHSSPDDLVSVRGFEPEVYATSARHHSGRFFYTTFVTSPTRIYRQPEWYAEDQRELSVHPPRFVVAVTEAHAGPDAPETFIAHGYVLDTTIGNLTVLERGQ